jgi:hypothetical protein
MASTHLCCNRGCRSRYLHSVKPVRQYSLIHRENSQSVTVDSMHIRAVIQKIIMIACCYTLEQIRCCLSDSIRHSVGVLLHVKETLSFQ